MLIVDTDQLYPLITALVAGLPEILEPFLQPNSEPFALALPADKMTEDEQLHFPQYSRYVFAFIVLIYIGSLFLDDRINYSCTEAVYNDGKSMLICV